MTILRSVFTGNFDYGDGESMLETATYTGSLTIGQSIFALNPTYGTTPNVKATSAVAKTNLGDNLYDDAAGGFFDVVSGTGDYLGTANYVVTTVADTFDHSDDSESLSIREAVDLANTTSGAQEIWIPAWKFTLTQTAVPRPRNRRFDWRFGYKRQRHNSRHSRSNECWLEGRRRR